MLDSNMRLFPDEKEYLKRVAKAIRLGDQVSGGDLHLNDRLMMLTMVVLFMSIPDISILLVCGKNKNLAAWFKQLLWSNFRFLDFNRCNNKHISAYMPDLRTIDIVSDGDQLRSQGPSVLIVVDMDCMSPEMLHELVLPCMVGKSTLALFFPNSKSVYPAEEETVEN